MALSYARWVAAIGRHYRAVVAASVAIALLCAFSLTRLRLDIDVLSMLPRGTPAFDDFRAFVGEFGQLDELFVIVDNAPPATLHRAADELTARLAALDTVAEVYSRIDPEQMLDGMLGTYLFNYIPESAYEQVGERLTPQAIDAQVATNRAILSAPFDLSAKRAVADDPLGFRMLAGRNLADAFSGVAPTLDAGYFTSRDGDALLLVVHPKGSAFDIPFAERLLAQVDDAVSAAQAELGANGVRVRYTGSYVFSTEDAATFKGDIARYTVLALLGVLAIFYLGYGDLRLLPYVTYPLIVITLITFGLSLLIYDQLNAVSLSFAAILYGMSIDSAVYFYSRLVDERQRNGGDLAGAITATLAGLGRANVAASATTAAGFAVIGLSVLSAVSQLGVLTAIGMAVTTLEFFTLYPALGFLLGSGPHSELRTAEAVNLARCAAWSQRHARAIRIALMIAAVLFIAGALRERLDPSLDKLRPGASSAMSIQEEIATRFTQQERGGAVLVRRSGVEAALIDAERVAALLRDYRGRGLVRSVQSIDAVLPSERTQRARLERYNALPRAAAVSHLRDALAQQGFKVAPFDPFLTAFAAPRDAIVRLGDPALQPFAFVLGHLVRVRGDDVVVAAHVDPADGVDWPTLATQLRQDLDGMPVAIAARPLLEFELGNVLRRELLLFLIFAFLGNLVLLLVIVRSPRLSLSVLAPVALIVLGLFAGMWLLGVAIDPVNLIVPPLIVGIGVDAGVYLAASARQRGSIEKGMASIGRAMMITALTTIAGFGFLAFSAYPPLATMGRLMAIALSLCLASTILILPALLPDSTSVEAGVSPAPSAKRTF